MKDLIKQIKEARFIYICGNGGSAATAEHFSNDLLKKRYPAICLSSNMSAVTMIANDYGYEYIFSDQLQVYANSEDLLITISCSGKSKNIINAHKVASAKDANIYSFEIFGKETDYGKLEDKHLAFAHRLVKKL